MIYLPVKLEVATPPVKLEVAAPEFEDGQGHTRHVCGINLQPIVWLYTQSQIVVSTIDIKRHVLPRACSSLLFTFLSYVRSKLCLDIQLVICFVATERTV